jgi:hypothetical protein
MPVDLEIAELQNNAMSGGTPSTVVPNDNHILHVQVHLPSLTGDLDALESGQLTPQLLQSAQIKAQHVQEHMKTVKPDKLQGKLVAELTRQVNNAVERVQAAINHAQMAQAKAQKKGQTMSADSALKSQESQADIRRKDEEHALKMKLMEQEGNQKAALRDSETASKIHAEALKARLKGLTSNKTTAAPAIPTPAPIAPAPTPTPPI